MNKQGLALNNSQGLIYHKTQQTKHPIIFNPIGCGYRIHRLNLGRGVRSPCQTRVLDMPLNNLMVLFTNPSARAGYDTRSIFKRSLTGFEFRVFLLLD